MLNFAVILVTGGQDFELEYPESPIILGSLNREKWMDWTRDRWLLDFFVLVDRASNFEFLVIGSSRLTLICFTDLLIYQYFPRNRCFHFFFFFLLTKDNCSSSFPKIRDIGNV